MKRIPIKVISTQDSEVLQVRFFPTDICNYDCSYCFPGSHDAKYRYPKNLDLIINNFKILFKYYKDNHNKRKIRLFVSGGGEPTLWPQLDQFCKELKETYGTSIYITIVSNGSRTTTWWSNNSKYLDRVVLSCHHEYVDIDHFIEVADLLFSAGVDVTALGLMDAQHWDKCVDNINYMLQSKQSWYIQAKTIVDAPNKGTDVYTPLQHEYINNALKRIPTSDWLLPRMANLSLHDSVVLFDDDTAQVAQSHTILLNDWNNFKGWTCKIGTESIAIDASGDLRASCGLSMFKTSINIFSPVFTMSPPSDISCTNNLCICQPDTHATKVKS